MTQKIRIVGGPHSMNTEMFIDDVKVEGVVSATFSASVEDPIEANTLRIKLIPREIEIEGEAEIVTEGELSEVVNHA